MSAGDNYIYDDYSSNEEQKLTDGSAISFDQNGFGNKMRFRFNDFFFSTHYRFKKGKTIANTGFYLHYYQ